MTIRILRVLEYEYATVAEAIADVRRWNVPAQGETTHSAITIRSAIVGGVSGFTTLDDLLPHACHQNELHAISDHPLSDRDNFAMSEYFMVMRCSFCADYWGVRFQYDPGTGSDNRYHRYGPDSPDVKIVARR